MRPEKRRHATAEGTRAAMRLRTAQGAGVAATARPLGRHVQRGGRAAPARPPVCRGAARARGRRSPCGGDGGGLVGGVAVGGLVGPARGGVGAAQP